MIDAVTDVAKVLPEIERLTPLVSETEAEPLLALEPDADCTGEFLRVGVVVG